MKALLPSNPEVPIGTWLAFTSPAATEISRKPLPCGTAEEAWRNRVDLSNNAWMIKSRAENYGLHVAPHLLDEFSLEDLGGLWEVDERSPLASAKVSSFLRSVGHWLEQLLYNT